ncbi:MAG: iron-containing alcohol dehydrogenase [Cardiobacteriaceae bacterium]|nr:iron-containing alcohol dehydrogenase [Cardiobacteriaceae bacterium]
MVKTTFVSRCHTGWGSLAVLPEEAQRLGMHNVLLLSDPFLKHNGMAARVATLLADAGINCVIHDKIAAEPPLALAESLVDFTRAQQVDGVIGLGGGSALDLAKLAAVFAMQDGKVGDFLNLSGTRQLEKRGLPSILIPTTAGTGSEVTNIAVLALETSKDVIAHDFLLPDVAIVDPELTVSVPARVTAATGIDALTHAIESYLSVLANPVTEALSLQAIRLIAASLRTAVHRGDDQAAREAMSYGSFLAGIAFFNAGVAGVHALAYPLGGQFHLAHGESNAVLLPYVMAHIRPSCEKKLKDIYEAMGFSAAQLSQEAAAQRCIAALEQLVADVGIPGSLQDFNIPESALATLTADACQQTRLLARSPMPLHEADIAAIYRAAWQGR